MSELKTYVVIGTVSSTFQYEIEAESEDEAREEAYCESQREFGVTDTFDVDDIYEGTL